VISRRRFLRVGLWGGALLGSAALLGRQLSGYPVDAALAARLRVLSPKELTILAAVARRLVAPDARDAPGADDVGVALFVDGYLQKLPPSLASDVRALLQLVEHGSGPFRLRGSRFTRMSGDEQDAALRDWQTSRLLVRRQGFLALRTLAFMGYYRDPRTWPLLGYSGPTLP
jgi:D-cysteine desulfhydrase